MPSCLQCSAAIPPALSLSERRSHATRILRPGGLCTTSPPACPDAGKAAGRESVFFSFSGAPSFTFSAKGGLLFLTFRFVAAPFRLCSVTTCFQPCRIAVFVNILLSRVSSARSIRSSRSSVDSDRRKQSIFTQRLRIIQHLCVGSGARHQFPTFLPRASRRKSKTKIAAECGPDSLQNISTPQRRAPARTTLPAPN